jgi:4-hydroxybenzoate polyprenyltransferase/phosphoserine phosphatase
MRAETIVAAGEAVPLFVDVDGTLVRADITLESFVRIARSGVLACLALILALLRGRAFAKAFAARRDPVDPARLPYRPEVLALIAEVRAEDRPVILASASHWRNVRRIAAHLDLQAPVIATRRGSNLKGSAKLAAIRSAIGADAPFDYVGDRPADVPLWQAARRAISLDYVPRGSQVERLRPGRQGGWRAAWRALRPHQWSKNALVLVPLLTSGLLLDRWAALLAIGAAIAMSLAASSIYLVNDLFDVDVDRMHTVKQRRPLASGDLSIPEALGLASALTLASLGLALWLAGASLALWIAAYMAISLAYSLRLKAVMVGDAIVLASLYTVRIWIGAVAIGVALSYWLLVFSVFLFLSLAYLKRYIEIRDAEVGHRLIKGRGYVGDDRELVMASGVAASMVTVLVLALFAHDPAVIGAYAVPDLLLLLCLPLLYWLNRIWLMARRGEVDGDPVAFTVRDPRSLAVGAVMAAIFVVALKGPGLLA